MKEGIKVRNIKRRESAAGIMKLSKYQVGGGSVSIFRTQIEWTEDFEDRELRETK